MSRERLSLVLPLMFLLVAAASTYVLTAVPTTAVAAQVFPVGLISGGLIVSPRRVRAPLAMLAASLATGVYVLAAEREIGSALGWGLAIGAGAYVTAEVVTARGTHRPALFEERDLRFFVGGCGIGSLVGGALTGLASLVTGVGEPTRVILITGLAYFAWNSLLVPHFLARPRYPGVAPLTERVVQWTATIAVTLLAFTPMVVSPSMVFVIMPFLGWAALRAPMRETLVQLLVVCTLAFSISTQGSGPFAISAGQSVSDIEKMSSLLALFVAASALTAIPFSIAVGVQRQKSHLARKEQAKVQRLVQSASGVAIIGTDDLGRIDLFNPGAQSVLGYTPDEVLGLDAGMFLTPKEISRLAEKLGTEPDYRSVAWVMAQPEHQGLDVEFVRKDGKVRTLKLTISQMHDPDGRMTGFVSTGEDVTRRVYAQRALEEALAAERRAVENLKEIDSVKDAFVSGVSHELRTPITSIMGYLELLEEGGFGALQPGQARALSRVQGNSRRLLSLIDDLLTLSRIHDGSLAVATCQLDLRDVIQAAHEEMQPGMIAAGIDFHCSVPDEGVFVTGDEERLSRVMVNLLGNAAKFTNRYGKVDLTLTTEGRAAVVAVRDTGIGIPADDQAKLFDRFFRSSVVHERAIQGSGLGLSIARSVVETHGGMIEVESGVGIGSTFRVRLPLEGAPPVPQQLRAERARAAEVLQQEQAEAASEGAEGSAGSAVPAEVSAGASDSEDDALAS